MRTVHDLISDQALDQAFASFKCGGAPDFRKILAAGLLKAAFGYSSGSSVTSAMQYLDLITKGRYPRPNKRGREYMRAAWGDRFSSCVDLIFPAQSQGASHASL